MKNMFLKLFVENKIITVFFILICFSVPFKASAATLSFSPSAQTVSVGDSVTVKILVNTLGKSINNAEGAIQFPADILEVRSMTKSFSVFSIWIEEPYFSNSSGKITFNGGVPATGFVGENGQIISITFKVKKQGTASVVFLNGTVRENDGLGTDITSGLSGMTITIKETSKTPTPAPKLTPTPTPVPVPVPQDIIEPVIVRKAPEIISSLIDGVSAISGTSGYITTPVYLTFIAQDGSKIFVTGESDIDGNFKFLVPSSLKHGIYAVTAVMVKEYGTISEISNAIIIKVDNLFFSIAWELWLFIITIVILIGDLIFHIYFHFRKKLKK